VAYNVHKFVCSKKVGQFLWTVFFNFFFFAFAVLVENIAFLSFLFLSFQPGKTNMLKMEPTITSPVIIQLSGISDIFNAFLNIP
jgi:hypothetical protein